MSKRWEGSIREWTGPEFGKSQRAVENRGKWRKLVAKSSVVDEVDDNDKSKSTWKHFEELKNQLPNEYHNFYDNHPLNRHDVRLGCQTCKLAG